MGDGARRGGSCFRSTGVDFISGRTLREAECVRQINLSVITEIVKSNIVLKLKCH